MRAALLTDYHQPLELVERPDPSPGPGEVVLAVGACGVCGSDRFLQEGGFGSTLPIVPGHEAAGIVAAVGEAVVGLREGQAAAIYYIQHCGRCRRCRAGQPNLCPELQRMGVDVDGAFAEYVTVPAASVLPVDDDVDLASLAVLTDAVGTGYHALTHVARVEPGECVLVIGIGGIGSNVVQLGHHLGARVIATSRSEERLELARRLGAQEVLVSDGSMPDALREVTAGEGPDVVVQTVGNPRLDRLAIDLVTNGGRVVLIGASTDAFEVRSVDLIWKEAAVLGSRGFTPQDILDVVRLYQEGVVTTDHLVQTVRPLDEANDALADLAAGKVLRTVLVPHRPD